MPSQHNYRVAPHLTAFAVPLPEFRALNNKYTYFVGGGLIFSRTAPSNNPENQDGKAQSSTPLRILLIQRAYEDAYGGQWEGPGGSIDPDDASILDGVAREVLEESGLHVSRFVELAGKEEWVKQRSDGVDLVVKFTFIVEVHEAKPALANYEGGHGVPTDTLPDGGVAPSLERRWEEMVKLDPAEHRDFKWVTEEEVRQGEEDLTGMYKSFAGMGRVILGAFQMMKGRVGGDGDAC